MTSSPQLGSAVSTSVSSDPFGHSWPPSPCLNRRSSSHGPQILQTLQPAGTPKPAALFLPSLHPTLGRCLVWDQPLVECLVAREWTAQPWSFRAMQAGSSEPDSGARFQGQGYSSIRLGMEQPRLEEP